MKKYNYIFFMAIVFLATTCSIKKDSEIPYGQEVTITAYSVETRDTKSTLIDGGTDVYWEPGDQVKLFAANKSSRLQTTIESPNKIAAFSGNFPVIIGSNEGQLEPITLWAVYPYRDDASFASDAITTVLPSEQTGREGSFAQGMNITIARANTFSMGFYNVCGGVRFRLTREGINKIVFSSNNDEAIAGKFKTTFDDGVPVVSEVLNGESSIVLTVPNEGTFKKDVWYYFCALPCTLSKGFTIRLETATQYAEFSSSSSVTIKRSVFGQIDGFDEYLIFTPKGEEPDEPGVVDLGLRVKWATCNLGASQPEEYGGYYQWAGIQDVSSTSIYLNFDNCPYHEGSSNDRGWKKYVPIGFESYCYDSGIPDNKIVLDREDDVVQGNLVSREWHMPEKRDFEELLNNCDVVWTTVKGVYGRKFTSRKNGNSIFLPAAGYRTGNLFNVVGSRGSYWSSSLYTDAPDHAYNLSFGSDEVRMNCSYRFAGHSIRPVYWKIVTGISFNINHLDLFSSQTFTIKATISPSDASEQGITWSSSDADIAEVDQNGKVTARSPGNVTITATTNDGGLTAVCNVSVTNININEPEAVDLGLSVKWASFNLGASSPEEPGYYFQWAGIYNVTNTDIILSWNNCPYHIGSDKSTGWTKYIRSDESKYWSGQGDPDNNMILDPEDDAAHVLLGDGWRMPTIEEFEELKDNCVSELITLNNMKVMKLTSTIEGYTDKSIIFPLGGIRVNNYVGNFNVLGYYWSSTRATFHDSATDCTFNYEYNPIHITTREYRYKAQSVRPVKEKS